MSLKTNIFNSLAALALVASATTATAQEPFVLFGHTGQVKPLSEVSKAKPADKAKAQVLKASNITWNITYLDDSAANGIGFNSASLGATRKATLNAVLEYISTVINHPGASCDLEVDVSTAIGGSTLAYCGAAYATVEAYDPGDVFLRLVSNNNRFASDADMFMKVDFATWNWNSDLSAPTGSEFDLFTVLLHEITHALGIASLTKPNGASQFTDQSPPFNTNTFTSWDNLLTQTSDNTKVWNASSRAFQLAGNGLNQGDSTIRFVGTNATTSFGQSPPIYTPTTFQSGSSVSHWQLASPIPSNAVMRPSVATGVSNRTYQAFEIQALKDLGYSLPASNVTDWNMY